jgi:hypothetical protein
LIAVRIASAKLLLPSAPVIIPVLATLLKAEVSTSPVQVSFKLIVVRLVQAPKANLPMYEKLEPLLPAANPHWVKLTHPRNAKSPMPVIVFGKVMVVKLAQFWKALIPIALMSDGQAVIPVKLTHSWKAPIPIVVSVLMLMLPKANDPTQPELVLFLM